MPFTDPTDISGLLAWYDLSDSTQLYTDTAMTANVTGDGDLVRAVADQSGNAHHIKTTADGYRPVYKTGIVNGEDVLRFAGGEFLKTVSEATNISNKKSIFVVHYRTGDSTWQCPLSMDNSIYPRMGFFITQHDVDTPSFYFNVDPNAADQRTVTGATVDVDYLTWCLQAGFVTPTTQSQRINTIVQPDTETFTLTDTGAYSKHVWLGCYGTETWKYSGDIAEVVIYDSDLTSVEIEQVESYLASKYNLDVPPKAGTAEITITGQPPEVLLIEPMTANIVVDGERPTLAGGFLLEPTAGTISITAQATTLATGTAVTVSDTTALTVTGQAATVSVANHSDFAADLFPASAYDADASPAMLSATASSGGVFAAELPALATLAGTSGSSFAAEIELLAMEGTATQQGVNAFAGTLLPITVEATSGSSLNVDLTLPITLTATAKQENISVFSAKILSLTLQASSTSNALGVNRFNSTLKPLSLAATASRAMTSSFAAEIKPILLTARASSGHLATAAFSLRLATLSGTAHLHSTGTGSMSLGRITLDASGSAVDTDGTTLRYTRSCQ
jgi:hypothetical protein